jgi:beta-lactamase class A
VPLPVGDHELRIRARGPGGATWGAPVRLWAVPASARSARGIGGRLDRRLQADLNGLTRQLPATSGVYVQHLVSGCGAAVNARAQFPAASTLKTAILLDAERRSSGRPSPAVNGLLDRMIIDSDDAAANQLLSIRGDGDGTVGAARVTETMRAMGLRDSLIRRPYIIEEEPTVRGAARVPIPLDRTRQPPLFTNFISTPYDLARIMVATHRGMRGLGPLPRIGVSSRTIRTQVMPRLFAVRDRSKLVAGVPSGVPVAHKTGYTENVKHDMGIVYLRSGPVVVVALSWDGRAVSDSVGNRFVANVGRAAVRRLSNGGRC